MKKLDLIVSVGASAGGVDALHRFVEYLEFDEKVAYVVIQHQKPSHKSMLTELLSKYTKLPVRLIEDGEPLQPGVNVAPSGKNLLIKNETIRLEDTAESWVPTPNVDYFLLTLAKECREKCVAVILSGTGSDGLQGCRAVQSEGGIIIAQKLDTADYIGMPQSVIENSLADFILPPEDMGQEINNIKNREVTIEDQEDSWYKKIIDKVYDELNVDFSLYKESTVKRRVERRIIATKTYSLEKYYRYILETKEEAENLYRDILIGVTAFFRDKEAFESFQKKLEDIIDRKSDGDSLRVWDAGCSTGEEAYTVAIIINELLTKKNRKLYVQIFATDLDEDSITHGRKGVYSPVTVEDMDSELKEKYILFSNGRVEVSKRLRESIVFSRHNMFKDPPFVKLDVVLCRNVLIYFKNELQSKVLNVFYYSLNYDGFLFLGKSESVANIDGGFEGIDEKHKIYRKVHGNFNFVPNLFSKNPLSPIKDDIAHKVSVKKDSEKSFEDIVGETLFKFYPGSLLVVDKSSSVIFAKGELHPYVNIPQGELKNNIYKMLHEGLSLEVRTLIYRARDEKDVVYSGVLRGKESEFPPVQISVYPIKDGKIIEYYVVCFAKKDDADVQEVINTTDKEELLEYELSATREYLQTVVEELETSNQELQSINEEFQSINEEFQASNEELETSNEELQSTNEELQSAYTELKVLYKEREESRKELLEFKESLEKANYEVTNSKNDIEEKERLISTIFKLTGVGISVIDEEGRFYKVNRAFCSIFGYKEGEVIGMHLCDILKSERCELEIEALSNENLKQSLKKYNDVAYTKDDKEIHISVTSALIEFNNGAKYKIITVDDISEVKRREKELSLVAKVFENTTEAIVITDENNNILQVNDATMKITGYRKDELIGQTPRILKSNWHDEEFYKNMFASLKSNGHWEGEIWDRRKNGETYISWFLILSIKNEEEEITNYIAISNEITEKKEQEEKIKNLAFFDSLTKLPNRTLFFDRISHAIERSKRRKNHMAVAFLDLDRFKNINDTYGHEVGDKLLKSIASRLTRALRKEDTVARIGGDEFTMIFENLATPTEIIPKLDKIREDIEMPLMIDNLELYTSASIGVSIYPNDGEDSTTLLKNADIAMYESKNKGKNRYNFFTKEMNRIATRTLVIETGLKRALDRKNFTLNYQPIYSVDGISLVGVEALLRWEHHEIGRVGPDEFIPIAEDSGLIIDIGRWVLQQAIEDIKEVWKETNKKFKLAINISSLQLGHRGFLQGLEEVCEKNGFEKEYINLEITESVIMDQKASSLEVLNEIKESKFDVSIDDFGAGYSSLSYLKTIPHNVIKIDKSFVGDIESDEDDKVIVEMVIKIAHTMNSKVIAEGVETKEQLEFLKSLDCDMMQGYYMAKPMSKEDLIKKIKDA